jgi:hypothetical protein
MLINPSLHHHIKTLNRKEQTMTNDLKANAIRANLDALKALLEEASSRVEEATAYADTGENLNTVIGTAMGLEDCLDSAQKLLGAALALHRTF